MNISLRGLHVDRTDPLIRPLVGPGMGCGVQLMNISLCSVHVDCTLIHSLTGWDGMWDDEGHGQSRRGEIRCWTAPLMA